MDTPEQNHKKYVERIAFYRKFGYDLEAERDLILDRSAPISGKILEIGTGKGHFALALAKRGCRFTSVDISKDEQDVARLNLAYHGLAEMVEFRLEDAERLRLPDKSIDVVFSINVFHHLKNPEIVLGEIARVLKPGGKVVLSDFSEKGIEIINKCHESEGRVHDHMGHDLVEARDYFASRGFEITESESEVQKVLVAEKRVGR